MHILRRLAVRLSWAFLPVTLFSLGALLSIWLTLSTPTHLKTDLKESGIYNSSSSSLLETISGSSSLTNYIDWESPAVKDALAKAFPPSLIESQSNKAIDNTYSWLRGDSDKLSFNLDFSSARDNFATSIGSYIYTRVSGLPACPLSSSFTTNFNPFTSACRPYGVTADRASALAVNEIQLSNIFKDTSLNASDLTNGAGTPLDKQFKTAPKIYQSIKPSLILSAVVVILSTAFILWLSENFRSGLKRLGRLYTIIGVVSGVLAYIFSQAANKLVQTVGEGSSVEDGALRTTQLLIKDVWHYWIVFALIISILGIGMLIWLRTSKPKPMLENDFDTTNTPDTTRDWSK